MILDDFQSAYKNTYVVKKCFWWIIAVVGQIIVSDVLLYFFFLLYTFILFGTFKYFFYQVATYIQVLWEDVNLMNENKIELMNGAVESIHTLCGIVPML